MSTETPYEPTIYMGAGGNAESDVNRTIVVAVPDGMPTGSGVRSVPKTTGRAVKGKREIEDLVGGVNINPYISSELDVSSDLEFPLEKIDKKYAVLTDFAQGGTATVSIARDMNLRRLVAIKSLKMGTKDSALLWSSFVAEAKVTAQLDHPGIIPIYDLFRDDENGIHLVMKLVNGRTLREYLRNITMNYRVRGIDAFDEDLLLRKRLEIFLRVCDTISYAHHCHVIHRDLKPENIMIGKYMEVFVMDWGLGKVLSEDGTPELVKGLSGTPRYFAPEVLRHEPLDFRSDIFTLGLILQEVVTLQPAVEGKDDKECMENIRNGVIAPIEHLYDRKINKSLVAIIQKAIAYDLQERYQTVDDLSEDLRRYMAGLSVSAKPESLWSRIMRSIFG